MNPIIKKKYTEPILLFMVFLLPFGDIYSQSAFDNLENWLLKHEVQITYGTQFAWYKESHITFVQHEYNRNIVFENVKAEDSPLLRSILQGRIGVNQFKINLGVKLSNKYSVHFITTHLTYLVRTNQDYYRNGTWNGQRVSDVINFKNHFKKLEHSNGINIWNVGVKRRFEIVRALKNNFRGHIGLTPQIGGVSTATQGEVVNPDGVFEHYDPGNHVAGFNYAIDFSFEFLFFEHLLFEVNYNYFQMIIKGAKLYEGAYVNQKLRGYNYGFSIGYKF